jgi:hypothetical protein
MQLLLDFQLHAISVNVVPNLVNVMVFLNSLAGQ